MQYQRKTIREERHADSEVLLQNSPEKKKKKHESVSFADILI
jgi:hypothetical protein